jgi:hypothetical protein
MGASSTASPTNSIVNNPSLIFRVDTNTSTNMNQPVRSLQTMQLVPPSNKTDKSTTYITQF